MSDKLKCVTRDGREWLLDGPANWGDRHVVSMRFSFHHGTWQVTFQKFPDSDRYGEISAQKDGVLTESGNTTVLEWVGGKPAWKPVGKKPETEP